MKKITTLLLALTAGATLNAQTQIGNAEFENWENVSGGSEPVNWNSFLTASGGLNGNAANQISSSTDARPGSSGTTSAYIWSRSILGVKANGNLTLGRVNMGSITASNTANHNKSIISDPNFSEVMNDQPDSLVFWAKFTPNGHNQNARIRAVIHDNFEYQDPEAGASASHIVATAVLNYPKTNGQWKRFSVPFVYSGPATSTDYILISISTNEAPGGGAADDKVWVDDVELIYNAATFTKSASEVCAGTAVSFTNTTISSANVTSYSWSFPGATPATSTDANPTVTYTTPGVHNVTLTVNNANGGSKTYTMSNAVTVNPYYDATFNYTKPTYCTNVSNPTPAKTGQGTFTATPAGLVFTDATTGEINLAASTPGTYTITFATATVAACQETSSKTVTLFEGSDASFAYASNSICVLDANPVPTTTEAGGTFSADDPDLTFANATTGEIDVVTSIAGTYTIQYVIGGACPDTVTRVVTLTATPDATFSYSLNGYCQNAANVPVPVFPTGANGGVFSSTAGLSINSNTGEIDLAASTPGTYSVTNNIVAVGSCPSDVHTVTVQVKEVPNVTLDLVRDEICIYNSAYMLAGGLPTGGTYTGTGVASNILNPAALQVDQTYTIRYTYTNPTTQCSNFAEATVHVDGCLGVEELTTEAAISIYPNPTTGMVTIENVKENAVYSVVSVTGQTVATGEVSFNNNKVDLSLVEKGIYLMQIAQGEKLFTIRVVKQ